MNKRLSIIPLAAAALMAMTPLTANAQTKPNYSSNYWSTARYVKIKGSVKASEYKVTVKDKKLNIVNKVIKTAKVKAGTTLYARNMGNGSWQVYNQQYPSSSKGVWLVKQSDTKWFSLAKVPTISKYWSTSHYATTTKDVQGIEYGVTVKDKKLNINNKKILKKQTVPSGTKLYARNMGNGSWQISNNDYTSSAKGVWLVSQQDASWLKKTTAPKAQTLDIEPSAFSQVSSNAISNGSDYTDGYAPFGFKPITYQDGFTINPGQKVSVRFDSANNQWVFSNNGKTYSLKAGGDFTVSTANSQYVPNSNNTNIQSALAPTDAGALVPNGYQPQNGKLWIQLNSDGSVKQYYFYTTQDKDNPGWVKGKIEQKDGKNTIVPE